MLFVNMGDYCRITSLMVLICLHQTLAAEIHEEIHDAIHEETQNEPPKLTPYSVTIIDREEIEAAYRRDLQALEFLVPGLVIDTLSSVPRGAAIALRGIGSADLEKSIDPAVAVLVDGVYIGTHQGQNPLLFDVEKVEVIRGVQGVYRGPAAIGGTINLTRSRPTGKLGGKFRIASTSHNREESAFVANLPAFSGLAVKIAGHLIEGDGGYMQNNQLRQRSENEENHAFATLSALWEFGESNSLQYTFDGEWDRSDTPGLLNISNSNDALCAVLEHCGFAINADIPETLSLNRISQEFSNRLKLDGHYQTLTLNQQLGAYSLTNITARRRTDELVNQDLDATSTAFFSRTKAQNYRQFSNDFRILSPANDNFRYLAGYYYQEDRYRLAQADHHILDWLAVLDSYTPGDPPPAPTLVRSIESRQTNKTHVLYSHFDFSIDERTSIDWGVRYTIKTNDFQHAAGGLTIKDEEWDKLTGTLGITYHADPFSLLFVRYSDADRGGGYSDQAVSPESVTAFQPERMETYEAGIKTRSEDGGLIFSITGYQTKWDEKLETLLTPVASGRIESIIDNASKVDVNGWEVEVRALPMDHLTVRAAYSHMDANYDIYDVPDLTLIATQPFAERDLSSHQPQWAPSDTFYFSGGYTLPLSQGTLSFYLAYRYSNDYQTNSLVNQAWVHNYGTTDIAVDYQWRNWNFRIFSTNLKNKRFLQNAVNLTDASVVSLAPGTTAPRPLSTSSEYNLPRYSGLEIRYAVGE